MSPAISFILAIILLYLVFSGKAQKIWEVIIGPKIPDTPSSPGASGQSGLSNGTASGGNSGGGGGSW